MCYAARRVQCARRAIADATETHETAVSGPDGIFRTHSLDFASPIPNIYKTTSTRGSDDSMMSGVEEILAFEGRFGGRVVYCGELNGREERPVSSTGWTGVDAALGGGLHEWFGVATSAGNDRAFYGAWTPSLLPLVHLVKRSLCEIGPKRRAVWIGRRCFPYGGVLVGADGDRRCLEGSIFVMADRPVDRLWAVDLVLRCPAVGVVVADGRGIDMAATRRVQLVAKNHNVPALLARPPWEVRELSAAQTRWWVCSESATKGRDGSDVLNPRWSIELLRCKGRQPERHPLVRVVEWDRGQRALRVLAPLAGATGDTETSTNTRRLVQA
jgi:hypothetical protein